jgi:diguanylate cyclase (GGDEF)-like protein
VWRFALPVLAFAVVSVSSAEGFLPQATTGVWYVLVFVWVGMWGAPSAVIALGPVAVASYFVPFAFGAPHTDGDVSAAVLVVPVAMVLGVLVSRDKAAEEGRRLAESRISTILEHAPVALFACDGAGTITFDQAGAPGSRASAYHGELPSYEHTVGGADVGRSVFDVFGDQPERLERLLRAMKGEEFTVDAELAGRYLDVCYKPIYGPQGVLDGATCVAYDVTDRVVAQRERQRLEAKALTDSRRQARADELTGLANRHRLYEHLDFLLAGDQASGGLALLLLDLDRFKEVNDALGHAVGDRLLAQVGARLSDGLRDTDLLARLGGDEFALLLGPGTDVSGAVAAAGRVIESFTRPFDLSDMSIHASVSVGVALYPDHATSRSELMRCADVAMYRAKKARHGFSVYDRGSDANHKGRLVAIEQLREGVGRGELVCYFQPQVAMRSRQVCGAEALVRWDHPNRGLLAPGEFLVLAEQTGLMGHVSRTVLDYALAECRRWHDGGYTIPVAVNLSVSDLLDGALPDVVAGLLRAHGLGPGALVLEITEDAIMVDPGRVTAVVYQLRALGVGLSVDDYGTGYSTLSYLRDLPVHELKLDRSFVTGISESPKDQAIVKATVSLARSLGLRLVAEGVETRSDWDYLRRLGVPVAQGYAVSEPRCPGDFAAWLADRPAGARRRAPALLVEG